MKKQKQFIQIEKKNIYKLLRVWRASEWERKKFIQDVEPKRQ